MNDKSAINKGYVAGVSVLIILVPLIGAVINGMITGEKFTAALAGKWFVFSAAGLRLFIAGIRQVSNPSFTAKEIFHIEATDSFPVVRELGYANICFGLTGIISLFIPSWRIVSAFASGLYYAAAGFEHVSTKSPGINEKFAMVSDFIIFILLLFYFIRFASF